MKQTKSIVMSRRNFTIAGLSAGAALLAPSALFAGESRPLPKTDPSDLPAIKPGTNTSFASMKQIDAGLLNNTIRAWLGHVSIDTTNIYAEVDLERKAQMLTHTNALSTPAVSKRPWKDNPSLMTFLRSI